ncbi:hypothetical protein ES707_05012 [subsurface metagenome]
MSIHGVLSRGFSPRPSIMASGNTRNGLFRKTTRITKRSMMSRAWKALNSDSLSLNLNRMTR